MSEEKRDAEKWLIDTCTTIHERDHDCLLENCQNPICKALCSLALIIEKIKFDAAEKMAESDLDEIMLLRKKIAELEAQCQEKERIINLAKVIIVDLAPSGCNMAGTSDDKDNCGMHIKATILQSKSTDGSRILRQLETGERLYKAVKGLPENNGDEVIKIQEAVKAYEESRKEAE